MVVMMEPRKAMSYGGLGINDSNMRRPSKQKRTRQCESRQLQLLVLVVLVRSKPLYTLQMKERTQVRR